MPRVPSVIAQVGSDPTAQPQRPTAPALAREQTGDRAANQSQENARAAFNRAASFPMGDGNLIQGVSFSSSGPTVIDHRLGTKAAGYVVVNIVGAYSLFYRVVQSDQEEAVHLTLRSSGTTTGDVWVYR